MISSVNQNRAVLSAKSMVSVPKHTLPKATVLHYDRCRASCPSWRLPGIFNLGEIARDLAGLPCFTHLIHLWPAACHIDQLSSERFSKIWRETLSLLKRPSLGQILKRVEIKTCPAMPLADSIQVRILDYIEDRFGWNPPWSDIKFDDDCLLTLGNILTALRK